MSVQPVVSLQKVVDKSHVLVLRSLKEAARRWCLLETMLELPVQPAELREVRAFEQLPFPVTVERGSHESARLLDPILFLPFPL